ncbi:unnamed protein product [Aphanomyces euteiches]
MRADFFQAQKGDIVPIFRKNFKNTLIVNMGYTKDEANAAIAAGEVDAVAFGTGFLANPDLPARFAQNAELNTPDANTFYVGGAKGYTDYPSLPKKDLFSTIKVGSHEFSNRVLMAPLTRARAGLDHVPNDLIKEYYTQRASAGLIITECVMIAPKTSAFIGEPGIYTAEQLAKWKEITDSVHAKGGKIFAQTWHGGRAVHPDNNDGAEIVAPSAIAIEGEVHTLKGKAPNAVPRALKKEEIPAIVETFATAAKNAIEVAGFDGVEIHGANGYLIDQFLRDGSNQRTDEYGGSLENRTRFLTEVLAAVTKAVGADKVGIRYSPLNSYNSMKDSNPEALSEAVAKISQDFNLAYVHVMRADFFQAQKGDIVPIFRKNFKNTLIVNMGYTKDEANAAIAAGEVDAVAFGTGFLANPDLPARFAQNAELNTPDANTFYVGGAKGYTDYPALGEKVEAPAATEATTESQPLLEGEAPAPKPASPALDPAAEADSGCKCVIM